MDINNVLEGLASQGSSVIVTSTEFSDLIGLVHRLFVMVDQNIVAELEGDTITNHNVVTNYQSRLGV